MGENKKTGSDKTRPDFPKRAVITAGMPYGNKDLHFGHIGGVFVHADIFSRFLRDRIGKENVIFVSGTDCYGSPIVEYFRQAVANGEFKGDISQFVDYNHNRQEDVLNKYTIGINLFAASSFSRSGEIHKELGADLFKRWHANGHLEKLTTLQFYDSQAGVYLNGRQVTGRCPIPNCSSEKGYADECSLGHPYEPKDLINPISTLTGKVPEMRDASNWYLKLDSFRDKLSQWVAHIKKLPSCRAFVVSSILEFLEPPSIYVKQEHMELYEKMQELLPAHTRKEGKTGCLVFNSLKERADACNILTEHSIRFRNGKTLVPFRLTGNIEWGLPAPSLEGESGLTFWVWPESLWAPISFTSTYLEKNGLKKEEWKKWWASKDSKVYQFIGEDNIYFYSLAEMSMFMALQGKSFTAQPEEGQLQLPELIVNNHLLFFDKKASSSGAIKPPMARDLLNYYTSDQLRAHFFALGLGLRSINFRPKPYNPQAGEKEGDPVLKEGNLLSNVLNRAVRSCFYTTQKFFDGKIPVGEVSPDVREHSEKTILDFEQLMYKHEFHLAMACLDNYIREINKRLTKDLQYNNESVDNDLQKKALIDAFQMVRTAVVLMHPIAPVGTARVLEFLNLGEEFWDWSRIFEPVYSFMSNPAEHKLKFLEPRVDFFEKHPSQIPIG